MPRSSTKMLSCRDRAERLEPAIKQSVLNPGLSSGQLQVVGGLGAEWNTGSRFLAPFRILSIREGRWHQQDNDTTHNYFFLCQPMMQCLYDFDIDRQRSCARNDSRNRQHAPRGAPCLSFFCKIFIL